ncbi:hypothetical protein NDU88_005213 [Pleurodeles waltl]|uniref:Uncharacterized protein n=1 Tax=Pleurodeles waltl TaxID=8319 RepID=A0AAV7LNL2_PLEWA|nr:hypothetical protein NDU88_005213 [Pleurodeles waltl]
MRTRTTTRKRKPKLGERTRRCPKPGGELVDAVSESPRASHISGDSRVLEGGTSPPPPVPSERKTQIDDHLKASCYFGHKHNRLKSLPSLGQRNWRNILLLNNGRTPCFKSCFFPGRRSFPPTFGEPAKIPLCPQLTDANLPLLHRLLLI